LIDAGILEEAPRLCQRCLVSFHGVPDGTLVVHDWDEFQINTGAERQKRYRERDRNVTRYADVTRDNDSDNDSDKDSDRKNNSQVMHNHGTGPVIRSRVKGFDTTAGIIQGFTSERKR
jgi:hypothetical protein